MPPNILQYNAAILWLFKNLLQCLKKQSKTNCNACTSIGVDAHLTSLTLFTVGVVFTDIGKGTFKLHTPKAILLRKSYTFHFFPKLVTNFTGENIEIERSCAIRTCRYQMELTRQHIRTLGRGRDGIL